MKMKKLDEKQKTTNIHLPPDVNCGTKNKPRHKSVCLLPHRYDQIILEVRYFFVPHIAALVADEAGAVDHEVMAGMGMAGNPERRPTPLHQMFKITNETGRQRIEAI